MGGIGHRQGMPADAGGGAVSIELPSIVAIIRNSPHRHIRTFFRRSLDEWQTGAVTKQEIWAEPQDLLQDLYLTLLLNPIGPGVVPGERYVLDIAQQILEQYIFRLERDAALFERYEDGDHGTQGAAQDPLSILITSEELQVVVGIVMDLPRYLNVMWQLHYLEDLPYSDIAKQYDLEASTVRDYVVRAHTYVEKRLRKLK